MTKAMATRVRAGVGRAWVLNSPVLIKRTRQAIAGDDLLLDTDHGIIAIMSEPTTPTCAIDRAILNEDTVGDMDDLGLAVFAKLCGANRGAFVLDPPDGKTYG